MTDRSDRAAKLWGDPDFTKQLATLHWMSSPAVQLHLNERSTGTAARDWLSAWAPRFFPPGALRILVLGCGEGWLERALIRRPFVTHIDAVDVATDAVGRAAAQASAEGLHEIDYRVADLNSEKLPENRYDVIIAHSILHHVELLEHALEQIERGLTPNGIFIMNEYVGPRRFQFSDQILEIMNELLRAIPERFRRGTIHPAVYHEKERPLEEQVVASDPSEAIRSDELLPLTTARFQVVDRVDLGGTILQHLLYDIVPNFTMADPLARSVIELLCITEAFLVDAGAIPSDYVLIAARKKGAPPLPRRRVALPALPPEGRQTMSDPLGFGPKRKLAGKHDPRAPRRLSNPLLRALRVSLLATEPNRATLNPDSAMHRWMEWLRFLLRRDRTETAFDHLEARLPEGSEMLPLLEAFERVTMRSDVPESI
jgi:2-polyprenyl-3-methyl-5-hydroxy-6-metoxy-1,4-benzoquinol methylase